MSAPSGRHSPINNCSRTNTTQKPHPQRSANFGPVYLKKFALPGLLILTGLACDRFPAQVTASTTPTRAESVPTINASTNTPFVGLTGKLVYTCQVNKVDTSDQICVINADGTGQRQLTDSADNQDASFSPDGKSIIFTSNQSGKPDVYEIYEMDLSGNTTRLTNLESRLALPAISPDNVWIAFTNRVDNYDQIWLMDRNGGNAHMIYTLAGNDAVAPTWSPNSHEILFAVGKALSKQFFIMGFDGRDPRLLSDQILTAGQTDWSVKGMIAYFTSEPWKSEVWTMNPDATGRVQVSKGGNAQNPSFSPDGLYISFTAYTNVEARDESSCEIFVLRLDGGEKWQLTDNDYCDYQPKWGN